MFRTVFIIFMFISFQGYGQCFDLVFSNCASLGNSSTVTATNTTTAVWQLTDPSGTVTGPDFDALGTGQTYNFNQIGTYEIQVTPVGTGCSMEIFYINIYSSSFSISTTNINACEGQVVNLGDYVSINNSTLTPLTYEWNIGGNIIYGENPSYTIPTNATIITVTATDGTGCAETGAINITCLLYTSPSPRDS